MYEFPKKQSNKVAINDSTILFSIVVPIHLLPAGMFTVVEG